MTEARLDKCIGCQEYLPITGELCDECNQAMKITCDACNSTDITERTVDSDNFEAELIFRCNLCNHEFN